MSVTQRSPSSDSLLCSFAVHVASYDSGAPARQAQLRFARLARHHVLTGAHDYARSLGIDGESGDDRPAERSDRVTVSRAPKRIAAIRVTLDPRPEAGAEAASVDRPPLLLEIAAPGQQGQQADHGDAWLTRIVTRSDQPAFLLDRDARLVLANALATAELATGADFLLVEGLLRPAVADWRPFADKIAAVADDQAARDAVLRFAGGRVRLCSIKPLAEAGPRALVLVLLPPPDAPSAAGDVVALLRARFRLSPGEADIALRLAEGHSLERIVAARGSAGMTVADQFDQLLTKFGVRSGSEAVQIVEQLRRVPEPR